MALTSTTKTMTTTPAAATQPLDGDDGPKWRVEHSVSDKATCAQAACKRAGTKIAKGELRIGTQNWWDEEQKYYRQWRHWGCATKAQIEGLKTLSGDDPAAVPGYANLSPESQEQVRLALEEVKVLDKEFKDIRTDLIKFVGGASGEIRNAVDYKVETTATGRAVCRHAACKEQGIKILKGELRLGIATEFQGEHLSWMYKHWKCISQYDLASAKEYYDGDTLEGLDELSEEYRTAVLETIKTGVVVVPPMPEGTTTKKKPKKARAPRKKKLDMDEEDDSVHEASASKPKSRQKRSAADADTDSEHDKPARKKKRGGRGRGGRPAKQVASSEDEEDGSAAEDLPALEPVPRAKPMKAVDPKVAGIEALTAKLRAEASK